MGSLGQAQQQNGLDASGLSNYLNVQQQEAQTTAPDAMGMLSSMLDQNKDGSSMDDLQRMAASFFK
nr:C678 [uncultured bacterium]ART36892.1 D44 [uncultured bacterium]